MTNRLLVALNMIVLIAVIVLFYLHFSGPSSGSAESEIPAGDSAFAKKTAPPEPARAPTGKIAYVNIDRLNEESLEISDLIAESKRRKNAIEQSVQSLSEEYQKKVEEFQSSQKAGIAPESEMRKKAQEIERIEKEAQDKQMMMDRLSVEINDKNAAFQKTVRDFMNHWNAGRYDFVLSYSEAIPSMLLGNPALEVTDEVIKGLNDEYKSSKSSKKKS